MHTFHETSQVQVAEQNYNRRGPQHELLFLDYMSKASKEAEPIVE